jgi:hypothetical protein
LPYGKVAPAFVKITPALLQRETTSFAQPSITLRLMK